MRSSFLESDVSILLKDISGMVVPLDTASREKKIQQGTHYSEMLPIEYTPSEKYLEAYKLALSNYAKITADAAANVAEKIYAEKGAELVLVSLARAGTSIGILIKRYLQKKYNVSAAHYTISIIRGRGIDKNAIDYILKRHKPDKIQFVDGWTGKGAIQNELNKAMIDYPNIIPGLAVLSDPAHVAEKTGTYDDFLIPSSCLNSTVSGLISRTFYRTDIIGADDFHGAVYYENLRDEDLTYEFIDTVESKFSFDKVAFDSIKSDGTGLEEVMRISKEFGIQDINLIKPSIGEATRVLLRRVPWKILVHSLNDNEHLSHLYRLADEKGVEVIEYPLRNYRACGLIRVLSDV